MARFTGEREIDYTFPQQNANDPEWWRTENAYYGSFGTQEDSAGLGEDAGESVVLTDGTEVQIPGGRAPAAAGAAPWWQSLITAVVPAAANVYQQSQLTKLNVERARQGLPPLTGQQYASTYQVPTATVQVGPSAQAQQWLKYGAIGIGIFVGLKALKII